jgi:hypothetical protein
MEYVLLLIERSVYMKCHHHIIFLNLESFSYIKYQYYQRIPSSYENREFENNQLNLIFVEFRTIKTK